MLQFWPSRSRATCPGSGRPAPSVRRGHKAVGQSASPSPAVSAAGCLWPGSPFSRRRPAGRFPVGAGLWPPRRRSCPRRSPRRSGLLAPSLLRAAALCSAVALAPALCPSAPSRPPPAARSPVGSAALPGRRSPVAPFGLRPWALPPWAPLRRARLGAPAGAPLCVAAACPARGLVLRGLRALLRCMAARNTL